MPGGGWGQSSFHLLDSYCQIVQLPMVPVVPRAFSFIPRMLWIFARLRTGFLQSLWLPTLV